MEIYTIEQYERYRKNEHELKKVTFKKFIRNLLTGLCFWCETNKAVYPKDLPQFCAKCFSEIITDKLDECAVFGHIGLGNFTTEQKQKGKEWAKQQLIKIRSNPDKFAEENEQLILKILETAGEQMPSFDD